MTYNPNFSRSRRVCSAFSVFLVAQVVIFSWLWKINAQALPPKLVRIQNVIQLLVHDKPFLILGGELGNSTASSNDYMRSIWPKLKQMNLNAITAPVYWELTEPNKNEFDFSLVDSLVKNARLYDMKLVLLWFGSWKNSMSCYAPGWVKTDTKNFPRAVDKNGGQQEILTPFSKNNLDADKQAFVKLMEHIRDIDKKENTVIAIQVENEIGMLPDARSYDEAATAAFNSPVPSQFLNYLEKNKSSLLPELKSTWEANGCRSSGNWEEIFGEGPSTDEVFMAWFYALFTNELAAAGKAIYDLPMYVNAALNRTGARPGQYPSAGPLPHLMDIWKPAAPSIDILAPDFYNPDFKHWCDLYTRSSNTLFIPEIRFEKGIDAKAFFAFGNYNCLSFSPFSIESTQHPETEPIGKAYDILKQITPLLSKYQPQGSVTGFLLAKDSLPGVAVLGNYRLTVKHEYTLGWSPDAKNDSWALARCIVIAVAPNEFYVAGEGVVVTFEPTVDGKKAGFLRVDEGSFEYEKWIPGRRMNGDQDHQGRHVRIPVNEYSIQHIKLYTY